MTRIIIAATPIYGHVAPLRVIAADLVRRAEAEEHVPVGRLRAVLPAHHVGAHLREHHWAI